MTDDIFDAVNAAIARAERCPTAEQRTEYLEEIGRFLAIQMWKISDLTTVSAASYLLRFAPRRS